MATTICNAVADSRRCRPRDSRCVRVSSPRGAKPRSALLSTLEHGHERLVSQADSRLLARARGRALGRARSALLQGQALQLRRLAAGVDRLARGLIGLGVRPGEKVALWMV